MANCADPYLTWHHFDPSWRVEQHQRPEGMIALCLKHASHADGGAYTDEQLRELKRVGAANTKGVQGEFSWLRQQLYFVAGKLWFHETPNLVLLDDQPIIWWRRVDGLIRVSLRIPGPGGWRLLMEDNVWTNLADAVSVVCPPRGRELEVRYPDGDLLKLEFTEVATRERAEALFGEVPEQVNFPSTLLKIRLRVQGLSVDLRHDRPNDVGGIVRVGGSIYVGNCVNGVPLISRQRNSLW